MRQHPAIVCIKLFTSIVLSMVLLACSGSNNANNTNNSTLGGTAATGAPIIGGTVTVKCAAGTELTTITNNSGDWQVTLSDQNLPCKLQVQGGDLPAGQSYHSLALGLGTVNITPITNLVVANLAAKEPTLWFAESGNPEITTEKVDAALNNVRTVLGLDVLKNNNPLFTPFKAQKGDPLDNALEALKVVFSDETKRKDLITAAQSITFTNIAATYATQLKEAYAKLPTNTTTLATGGTASNFTCKESGTGIRAPSVEEFARYVKTYTGDIYIASKSQQATAELKSNGELVVGGKTYTPTSFCFDTVIGAEDYGNTLYAFFPEGKTDLWHKNSKHSTNINLTSTPPATGTEGNTGGSTTSALGSSNGASAIFDGKRITSTSKIISIANVLADKTSRLNLFNFTAQGEGSQTFNLIGLNVSTAQNCVQGSAVSASITIDDRNTFYATSCSITLDQVPQTSSTDRAAISGRFSGTFFGGASPSSITVTDGVFRFIP